MYFDVTVIKTGFLLFIQVNVKYPYEHRVSWISGRSFPLVRWHPFSVMEPVSSVFFRDWLGGEVLRTKQYVGTFSILLAMVSTEAGTYVKMKREAALG